MSTDQYLCRLRDEGFIVLPNIIPVDESAAICEKIDLKLQALRVGRVDQDQGVTALATAINHEQSFSKYLAHPDLMKVMEGMLGEGVRISFSSIIVSEPGKSRSEWHADWPYNQRWASRITAPYPDICKHLVTLWMLSPFTKENGGTLIVPGSHRTQHNPTGDNGIDAWSPYPTEFRVTGEPGTVLVFDARLWHCPNINNSTERRYALAVRYAPWWLNLNPLHPDNEESKYAIELTGRPQKTVPLVRQEVYDELPDKVKPLYRHWVERPVACHEANHAE